MIHSLSGGVIGDNMIRTYVKVEAEGITAWYLSPTCAVAVGARVLVPVGKNGTAEGTVLKVEQADRQCAPCPINRMREILSIVRDADCQGK